MILFFFFNKIEFFVIFNFIFNEYFLFIYYFKKLDFIYNFKIKIFLLFNNIKIIFYLHN